MIYYVERCFMNLESYICALGRLGIAYAHCLIKSKTRGANRWP